MWLSCPLCVWLLSHCVLSPAHVAAVPLCPVTPLHAVSLPSQAKSHFLLTPSRLGPLKSALLMDGKGPRRSRCPCLLCSPVDCLPPRAQGPLGDRQMPCPSLVPKHPESLHRDNTAGAHGATPGSTPAQQGHGLGVCFLTRTPEPGAGEVTPAGCWNSQAAAREAWRHSAPR